MARAAIFLANSERCGVLNTTRSSSIAYEFGDTCNTGLTVKIAPQTGKIISEGAEFVAIFNGAVLV